MVRHDLRGLVWPARLSWLDSSIFNLKSTIKAFFRFLASSVLRIGIRFHMWICKEENSMMNETVQHFYCRKSMI